MVATTLSTLSLQWPTESNVSPLNHASVHLVTVASPYQLPSVETTVVYNLWWIQLYIEAASHPAATISMPHALMSPNKGKAAGFVALPSCWMTKVEPITSCHQ